MCRQRRGAAVLLVCIGVATAALAPLARTALHAETTGAGTVKDKYSWLEDVSSTRAMDWVKGEDARTDKVLEADPHYAPDLAAALTVAEDPNRLPLPSLRSGEVYNSWRDAANPRGLLRKTALNDYLRAKPTWQTVIDFDALGRQENTGWVSHGLSCLYPGDQYCMVALSAGGEDAATEREFDLKSGQFVPNGFTLARSKQDVNSVIV